MFATRYIFTFLSVILISSCIPVKDANRLWESGSSDDMLTGTWTMYGKTNLPMFQIEVQSDHMICAFFLSDVQNQAVPSYFNCRTVMDSHTGMRFLVLTNAYTVLVANMNEINEFDEHVKGALIPYRMNTEGELAFLCFAGNTLSNLIVSGQIEGGFLQAGGNPPSRSGLRPFLECPTEPMLHMLAEKVVYTNTSPIVFRRLKDKLRGATRAVRIRPGAVRVRPGN